MSAAEGANEASSPEQANELVVQANERTDERVAQYLRLDSCLFQTIVRCPQRIKTFVPLFSYCFFLLPPRKKVEIKEWFIF